MTDRDRETLEAWLSIQAELRDMDGGKPGDLEQAIGSLLERLEAADQSAVKAIGDAYAKLNRAEDENERLRGGYVSALENRNKELREEIKELRKKIVLVELVLASPSAVSSEDKIAAILRGTPDKEGNLFFQADREDLIP